MQQLYSIIARLYDEKVPAQGLALFRMVYVIVLGIEVAHIYYFRHLILDTVPYLEISEMNLDILLVVWFVILLFIFIGCFTRYAVFVNYCFTLITFSSFSSFEYHLDYSIISINFLLLFIPIERTFSLDKLIEKLKYSTLEKTYNISSHTSYMSYFLLVSLGIGFVYFDSIFYKFASPMWLKGLGFWLPASLPFATYLDLSFILDNKTISYIIGYFTLFFESLFLFFIWNKKTQLFFVISGLILHIGILLTFPVPLFALNAICLYLLLVPNKYWSKLYKIVKFSKCLLTVYYSERSLLHKQLIIIIEHFDFFSKINFVCIKRKNGSPEFYSIDDNKNKYVGIDNFLKIFSKIWFLWPISLICRLPFIRYIIDYAINNSRLFLTVEKSIETISPRRKLNYGCIKLLNTFYVRELKIYMILVFIVYCSLSQLVCISNSFAMNYIYSALRVNNIASSINSYTEPWTTLNTRLLGITRHPVFVDGHFKNYTHIVAITHSNASGEET